MNLAYIYPEHLGKPQARVLQTAATLRAMARLGAEVHFLVGRFRGLKDRLGQLGLDGCAGLEIEALPMWQPGVGLPLVFSWHGLFHLAVLARLRRLKSTGTRVVLLRHLKMADFLLKHKAGLGLKLVYEAHEIFAQTAAEESMDPKRLARLSAMENRVLDGVDQVVAISQPLAKVLEARPGAAGPVAIAPSGADQAFFHLARKEREPGLVAYAGGLSPWKGVDLLFEAVAQTPEARLEVLGGRPGSEDWQRLTRLAHDLGIEGRLQMRPHTDQDEVRELLGRAQVAVWPGTGGQRIGAEYTSPLKLFESLAAGCAVTAPDVPAAATVVKSSREALLFKPDDAASLAWAIGALLKDFVLREKLGRAGHDLAKNYTWEARSKVLLRVLEELVQ